MRIKVNEETVEIFAGACVKDAVLKYSRTAWKQVQDQKKTVFDLHGHEVAPDGELSEGDELFVKKSSDSGKSES